MRLPDIRKWHLVVLKLGGLVAIGCTVVIPSLQAHVSSQTRSTLCSRLKNYPYSAETKLSFERGEVSTLCQDRVPNGRQSLDQCGSPVADPYSQYTWSTRKELLSRGKLNLFINERSQSWREEFDQTVEKMRTDVAHFCCAGDVSCQKAFARVQVSLCKPAASESAPDSCAFEGAYSVQGIEFVSLFSHLKTIYTPQDESFPVIERNLPAPVSFKSTPYPQAGRIVLTSYVPRESKLKSLVPILQHEWGHACMMIQSQLGAVGEPHEARAHVTYLDQARKRCEPEWQAYRAYRSFWQKLGESAELAQCFERLTNLNRQQKIDKSCPQLCPGHYMEETVGIAFSLLTGDLTGKAESVFPNTCHHVRDGQHPMVADVVECLAQYSPKFRNRLARAYHCS